MSTESKCFVVLISGREHQNCQVETGDKITFKKRRGCEVTLEGGLAEEGELSGPLREPLGAFAGWRGVALVGFYEQL